MEVIIYNRRVNTTVTITSITYCGYSNKEDIQNESNYRGDIKLMNYTIKLRERVIEQKTKTRTTY